MDGLSRRGKRRFDANIALAWHTAVFALNGYAGKLKGKSLGDYLSTAPRKEPDNTAKAIAFFHSMRSAGFDVKITRE